MNVVTGLNIGADDYVAKPLLIIQLSVRINANLRKHKKEEKIETENITLDLSSQELLISEQVIALTVKEFELLHALLSLPNKVKIRKDLLNSIWGYDYPDETRTLDMHIKTLRNKISDTDETIETVRGISFKFCPKERL